MFRGFLRWCAARPEYRSLTDRTASVYLRALLPTGARREELAALTWANVDIQWRKLTIADKVDSTRTIPLTPYLAQVLATLPRVGPYVFASTGKAGRITDARSSPEARRDRTPDLPRAAPFLLATG